MSFIFVIILYHKAFYYLMIVIRIMDKMKNFTHISCHIHSMQTAASSYNLYDSTIKTYIFSLTRFFSLSPLPIFSLLCIFSLAVLLQCCPVCVVTTMFSDCVLQFFSFSFFFIFTSRCFCCRDVFVCFFYMYFAIFYGCKNFYLRLQFLFCAHSK